MTTAKQRNRPPTTGATQADTLAAMQILLVAGIPVLLWGDPGTGKTSTIEAFARRAGWRTVSVIASIHDPTDFAGLPVRTEAGVVFEPPAWARRTAESNGVSLVFFDEVNTATPATQNALMKVVLEGRVGDLELGEGVRFAAAANPPSQNSAAWDLSAPLANRFAHLEWPVSFEDWKAGYLGGWPEPDPLDIDLSSVDPFSRELVRLLQASFLATRPALVCELPENGTVLRGWPSPRSWERLADCLAMADTVGVSADVRLLVASALVGEGAAVEYLAYLRNLDLLDPKDLLAYPAKFGELRRTDQQFAALEAVVAAVAADPKCWSDAFRVCIVAAGCGVPDVAASAAMRLAKIKPPAARLPAGHEVFTQILADAGLLEDSDT
ncbi:MAG: AAA domain-containing protein [Acidimicrobiaceae bacterium]|nr:AAA domain-containing protein [Acidimicrobiaceae bacterium]